MQRERKLQAIRKTLGRELVTKGDEVTFLCPSCKHRKPKLTVNLSKDRFHCWVCAFSGKTLLALFQKGSPERREYADELTERSNVTLVCKTEHLYDTPALPADFRSLSRPHRGPYYSAAIGYLGSRGITADDIVRWKLGYCEDGEYKNRIIIPSFDENGELNFVTSRSIYEGQQKYKNGNYNKDIIFNDYMVDWNRPITITEGPFDAFKVHDNAVALQGSLLRTDSRLFSKIVVSGVDVYFALDSDAYDKQVKMIGKMMLYGVTCYSVPLMGKKDVGEMTTEEFVVAKSKALRVSSQSDILKLRVLS